MGWAMSFEFKPMMTIGAALSLGFGAVSTWKAKRLEGAPLVVSQRGRDQEAFNLVKQAKRTITVRTESLTMVPFVNELAQAQQRGVKVSVLLPLEAGVKDDRLGNLLMSIGAVVQWKEDGNSCSYKGAYIEVDEERFLYSAVPMKPVVPGASVSFVSGKIFSK